MDINNINQDQPGRKFNSNVDIGEIVNKTIPKLIMLGQYDDAEKLLSNISKSDSRLSQTASVAEYRILITCRVDKLSKISDVYYSLNSDKKEIVCKALSDLLFYKTDENTELVEHILLHPENSDDYCKLLNIILSYQFGERDNYINKSASLMSLNLYDKPYRIISKSFEREDFIEQTFSFADRIFVSSEGKDREKLELALSLANDVLSAEPTHYPSLNLVFLISSVVVSKGNEVSSNFEKALSVAPDKKKFILDTVSWYCMKLNSDINGDTLKLVSYLPVYFDKVDNIKEYRIDFSALGKRLLFLELWGCAIDYFKSMYSIDNDPEYLLYICLGKIKAKSPEQIPYATTGIETVDEYVKFVTECEDKELLKRIVSYKEEQSARADKLSKDKESLEMLFKTIQDATDELIKKGNALKDSVENPKIKNSDDEDKFVTYMTNKYPDDVKELKKSQVLIDAKMTDAAFFLNSSDVNSNDIKKNRSTYDSLIKKTASLHELTDYLANINILNSINKAHDIVNANHRAKTKRKERAKPLIRFLVRIPFYLIEAICVIIVNFIFYQHINISWFIPGALGIILSIIAIIVENKEFYYNDEKFRKPISIILLVIMSLSLVLCLFAKLRDASIVIYMFAAQCILIHSITVFFNTNDGEFKAIRLPFYIPPVVYSVFMIMFVFRSQIVLKILQSILNLLK